MRLSHLLQYSNYLFSVNFNFSESFSDPVYLAINVAFIISPHSFITEGAFYPPDAYLCAFHASDLFYKVKTFLENKTTLCA